MKKTFLAFLSVAACLPAQDDGVIPRPMREDTFEALMANPPFTRSLGISETLILTGVAKFDQDVFATLMDTKTMQSQIVSKVPNREGWQLISVGGNPAKAETWIAKIQIRGGEIVSIRYQKPPPRPAGSSGGTHGGGSSGGGSGTLTTSQISEARNAAVNYKEGFTSDGYPDKPPREMVEKLSRLSVGQREDINREMISHRNRGLGLDARRQIYEGLVNRAMQRR